MSIAASGDGFTSSEDEGAVGLPPSGVVATAAPDPELTAMLARAAVSIGLEVNRPPSPEPSRLDDWFLGAGRGSRPAPVPFFPEVHEELTSSWMAPFTARSRSSASSVLTTLDGGVARGYAGIPQVERAVAVHLCPRNAATWRNRPRLPSKACKLTAALAAKAYSAAGQAASALHAMAILQVHQAKALKQVHEGSTDPGLMQELRTATDFALRATKVTARSLGKAMSTMVVQERHLWLNLAEMKDVDKARFLDAPISQGGLFGDTVEGFAQQFSAVQQQTEAIQHILPRRDAPSTAAPGARPQSARRRGRPPASSRAAPPQAESTHRPVRRASRRRAAPKSSKVDEAALTRATRRCWSLLFLRRRRTAPLLPPVEGREENLLFRFVSVPPLVQGPAVPTFSKKEQFPFPPGSQVHGTTVCDALPPHSRPRPILPVAKRVRFGDDIPPHAPLASPVRDPGSSVRMPQNAPPSVPSTPTPFRCTTTGTSIVPLEPLAQRLEAWLTLPSLSRWLTRTIRLGYAIQFARRPPKFNGVLETSVAVRNAPVLREEIAVLLAKDAIEPVPPAEMRQGFYSPYFIVPKKGGGLRPILDLRVLNRALHKLPFKMLTHRRMIKCIQPQDWFAAIDLKDAYFHVSILPRHRPFLRFAFEGRALPSPLPCVHEGCRGRPYPVTGSGRQDPQLPRRLAYSSPIQRAVGRSQGLGAPAPQPVGASGQLGKEQALPCAENLFSRCGVRLGEYDGTPHGGTCPSSAELPEFLQRQECGTTETVSEAPGAYGIRSCSHAARIASYETTSALATLPGPEVGMAPRYTASRYLPAVSPLPQPLDRPCLSTGRGAPRTSVPAYCCHNRCLQHGLGRYMQRAGSLGALDRAPTALAHQLPGAVGSAFSLAAVPATAVGQARASPHGQHCGVWGVYDHTACHSSPAISSSGVTRSSSHCVLFTSRGSSIVRPTRSHDSSRSPENGDSIPRRSGWSGVDSGKLR